MPDSVTNLSVDVTARLVEQLTQATERLERLEAAIREVNLLPALQREPIARGPGPEVSNVPGSAVQEDRAGGQRNTGVDATLESEAHFRRGVELCQMNQFDAAVAAWKQVLRLQPDNAHALANIGIVYTEQARWSEAQDMFTRVVALMPDNAEAYYGLSMADAQLGDYAAACAALETALLLKPDNADARYNLVIVRQQLALDNVASVPSLWQASDDTMASENDSDPLVSMPAQKEAAMLQGSARNNDVDPVAGFANSAPPEVGSGMQLPRVGARRMEPENAETYSTVLTDSTTKTGKSGLLRTGLIAAAAVTLVGYILVNRFHPSVPISGRPAASSNPMPQVTSARPPETASLSASRPEPPTIQSAAAPPATIPAVSANPAAVPPRSINARVRDHRPALALRKSRSHPSTGRRLIHAAVRAHRSQPRRGASHKEPANRGYNQGIDKLLDRMP